MLLALALIASFAFAASASAASFTVNSTEDAPLADSEGTTCVSADTAKDCTLRAAVQAADNAGGASTITLPAGVFTLTTEAELDVEGATASVSLTVAGAGAGTSVIEPQDDRAFYVDESDSLSLSGVTVSGGDEYEGGAIYNEGTLTVTAATFQLNEAEYGGAIYNESTLTVTAATFQSNEASSDGGAIYNDGGLEVASSTFDSNEAEYGAAIYNDGGLEVASSTFARGYASEYAGAIYNDGGAEVTGSTFDSNEAYDEGGALYNEEALTVIGSTLRDNAAYEGGAIYDAETATIAGDSLLANTATYGGALYLEGDEETVLNDTVYGNTAGEGAALYLDGEEGAATLTNDTIVANHGGPKGGAVTDYSQPAALANTIVADNQPKDCSDGPVGAGDKGANIDSDGSCFAVGGSGATPETAGDQPSIDPGLATLAGNGGPTETIALLAGSPAIGKGLAAYCPASDQRGVARPVGACDVGAYQTAPVDISAALSAPANVTQGDAIAYTLTVANSQSGAAGGVTVTDTLPAGTTLYSAVDPYGSCAGTSTLTCTIGTLQPGASATVRITAIANATGTLTNTAVASVADDQNAANNTATATTLVRAFPVTVAPTLKPLATTGKVSEKAKRSVLISGTVNPEGTAATWRFAYGTSKKHLRRHTVKRSVGSGGTPIGVLALIKGLKPHHRYYIELIATNANGTTHGKIIRFKTSGKKPKHHKKHGGHGHHKHHKK